MEATYRTKAIILDRQPSAEYDARVVVYSWDKGKLELTARGTAKLSSKLAGHLEPFNLVDLMVINGRGSDYAGAASSLSVAPDVKSDWAKLQAGAYVLALYKRLLKPDTGDKKVFLLLAQFIYWLNAVEAHPLYYQAVARLAAWRFVNILGLASPELIHQACPPDIKSKLLLAAESDFVATLKILKFKSRETVYLIKYLDKLIQGVIE